MSENGELPRSAARALIAGLLITLAGRVIAALVVTMPYAMSLVSSGMGELELPSSLMTNVWLLTYYLSVISLFAALGAYVTSQIAQQNVIRNTAILYVLTIILQYSINYFATDPDVYPASWYFVSANVLLPISMAFGAYVWVRFKSDASTSTQQTNQGDAPLGERR